MRTDQTAVSSQAGKAPTHIAKVRTGAEKGPSFERIGVAWVKPDGSIFVRLHGTQIVSEGFTLYPND